MFGCLQIHLITVSFFLALEISVKGDSSSDDLKCLGHFWVCMKDSFLWTVDCHQMMVQSGRIHSCNQEGSYQLSIVYF